MRLKLAICIGTSLLAIAAPAYAQSATASQPAVDTVVATTDIIVQARRRDETQQDVPLVVDAVTAETISKLNIREFTDIQRLVPGLSLNINPNGIGAQAALRGIAFDVNASGNNGTIEFYMNDAPILAGVLFQSMFDVSQIEVLRGPQGTLRGRASPSGSITVTSRLPQLSEAGGYATGTVNDIHGWNGNFAFNVPIIQDVLAIRAAGLVDENQGNRVRSINSGADPFIKTVGGRISARFEPTDWIRLSGSFTTTERKAAQFEQAESLSVQTAGALASPVLIEAGDRRSAMFLPRSFTQRFKIYNWQAQVRFAGQKLDYVGSNTEQNIQAVDPLDRGGVFNASFPAALRSIQQANNQVSSQTTHEVRLSNEDRVFGMFDYVIGGLYSKLSSPTSLTTQTPLFIGIAQPVFAPSAASFSSVITTPITRGSNTVENSIFGNVTAHIAPQTEISGGIRYIDYKAQGFLNVNGASIAAANQDQKLTHTIYSASAKHNFSGNLMVYASYGSSWRASTGTNPTILRDNIAPSPLLQSFYFPKPETSDSFELGFKSEWFDKRLRLNVTAYHQTFENYIYSARGVFFAGTDATGAQRVFQTNPAVAVGVPAKVKGVEAEFGFKATPQWDISATLSYSDSKIKNGVVPCNDYFPHDGTPDNTTRVPTLGQITTANGGEQLATCSVNYRAGLTAPFSATVQTEYRQPISNSMEGYVRGLLAYQGNSQNDPSNFIDDIKAYATLDLFAGVRDADGAWEVGFYAKNVLDTNRVLSRNNGALNVGYQQLFCPPPPIPAALAGACPTGSRTVGGTAVSTYRNITYTAPREFGLTARIAFGSR